MSSLPGNVHVSTHPCLRAKLSQLRSSSAQSRETKALVHEISLIVGCEALAAGLTVEQGPPVWYIHIIHISGTYITSEHNTTWFRIHHDKYHPKKYFTCSCPSIWTWNA